MALETAGTFRYRIKNLRAQGAEINNEGNIYSDLLSAGLEPMSAFIGTTRQEWGSDLVNGKETKKLNEMPSLGEFDGNVDCVNCKGNEWWYEIRYYGKYDPNENKFTTNGLTEWPTPIQPTESTVSIPEGEKLYIRGTDDFIMKSWTHNQQNGLFATKQQSLNNKGEIINNGYIGHLPPSCLSLRCQRNEK